MGSFGVQLRTVRLSSGLTQEELSEQAGVSVRTLRDIELNRAVRPRMTSLRRLASAAGMDPWTVSWRTGVEVGVLGTMRVRVGERTVAAGTLKQRQFLALLGLHAGQPVGREEIVDVLWGDRPPASCRNLVHTYASRLRALLGAEALPVERGRYRLTVQLDVARFDELAGLGRLEEALACWRGPLLADLPGRLRQHPAAEALRRRRIGAALAYAELAFRLGAHTRGAYAGRAFGASSHGASSHGVYDRGACARAAERLGVIAHEEPLHEALHAQLMLALAGSGERAAALDLYARISDRLRTELGVAPGPQLRAARLRTTQE